MVQILAGLNELQSKEYRKIMDILASIEKLSPEEQKAKKAELEKIRKEKGEKGVQDFLLKKFGLN